MQWRLVTGLLVTGLFAILFWSCPGATPDKAPTERVQPLTLADFLPDTHNIALGVVPGALEPILMSSFGAVEGDMAALWEDFPPILKDLLGPQPVAGVDRSTRQLIVVSTMSHEDLLRYAEAGAPLPSVDILAGAFHARVVVQTTEPDVVGAALQARCADRSNAQNCEEFLHLTPHPGFLSVDFLLGEHQYMPFVFESLRARLIERLKTSRPRHVEATAAWLHFEADDQLLAIHARIEDLFALFALFQSLEVFHARERSTPEGMIHLLKRGSAYISNALLFQSPEVAEIYDISFSLRRDDQNIVIDTLATLTPYGEKVLRAGRKGATFSRIPTVDPAAELTSAYDFEAAIKAAQFPRWASAPEGADPRAFAEALNDLFAHVDPSRNLAYLQYPISMVASTLERDETSYRQYRLLQDIRGLWLRAGLRPDTTTPNLADLLATMHILARQGSDLDELLATMRPMLQTFGVQSEEETITFDDRQELLTTVGGPIDELLSSEPQTFHGTRLFVDLRRLDEFAQQVAPDLDRHTLVDRYPHAHYTSTTSDHQWRIRLQFGPDEPHTFAPIPNALIPDPPTSSPCAFEAARISTRALSDNPDSSPEEVIKKLQTLRQTCPDDTAATERIDFLIPIWQTI